MKEGNAITTILMKVDHEKGIRWHDSVSATEKRIHRKLMCDTTLIRNDLK